MDTTSPFLYLCGVAGKDLGDVGVDRGRGSKLELEVRDCDVSDRLGRPPCANNAPGVKLMDRNPPWPTVHELVDPNEMSSFFKSSSSLS